MRSTVGRLPDFLVVGAAKAGTSTLLSYLQCHTRVFDIAEKEPCFFDDNVNWGRGVDWYRGLFAGAREDELCGEASTNYTRFPQVRGVPERIKSVVPDVKLIYLVRHPIDRAYSHYVHRCTREIHTGEPIRYSFEEFVEREPMCVDGSDYALQVERYLEHFPLEKLLVVRQDALAESPSTFLARVQSFLNLPEEDLVGDCVRVENDTRTVLGHMVRARITGPLKRVGWIARLSEHMSPTLKQRAYDFILRTPIGASVENSYVPPPMRPDTRARLLERYNPSIDRLEELTGEDFSSYRT